MGILFLRVLPCMNPLIHNMTLVQHLVYNIIYMLCPWQEFNFACYDKVFHFSSHSSHVEFYAVKLSPVSSSPSSKLQCTTGYKPHNQVLLCFEDFVYNYTHGCMDEHKLIFPFTTTICPAYYKVQLYQ